MVTQKLTIRLDESELPEIRMVSGDIGREIQIEVYAREDSENTIDLETYSAEITLIKPDNTFIMDNFTIDKYELPEQAGAVSGSGYYQIKIFTAGDHQIYTGQGRFLVDDMILSDDVIESSSIAFGDRFPEDFATKEWVDDEIEAHGIGTYVAGNPAGEETMPPLVRLQINNDIYPLIHKVEEQEDADITDPAEGDVLTYDADDQKWKNEPLVIPDPTVTKTATGNPIEISDGADAPLVKCVTQIQGYQSGTGTPSSDNIRPIVAYSTGEIVVGVNAWDQAYEIGSYNRNTGETTSSVTTLRNVNYVNVEGGQRYYFKSSMNDSIILLAYQADGTYIGTYAGYDNWVNTGSAEWCGNKSILMPSNCAKINFILGSIYGTTYKNDIFIYKVGSITTHSTTYPTSIYRGSEDVVNGSAVCEKKKITISGDVHLYGKYGSDNANLWYYDTSDIMAIYNINNGALVDNRLISNMYTAITTQSEFSMRDFEIRTNALDTINRLYFRDSRFSTATEINTYLSSNPLEVVYKLATPTTSSVTTTNLPIKSLSGYTHIESTTGEMEVEYITQQWDAIMTAAKLDNLKVYSTAEHVVGKWVDGKDIYEQTFVLSNEITLAVNQWNSITGVSLSGVETPIDVEIRSSRGTSAANVDFIDSPVSVWGASGTEKVKSITFRYTKTS